MKKALLLTLCLGTFLTPADQPVPAGQPDENGSLGVTSEKFTFKVVDQDNKPVKGATFEMHASTRVDKMGAKGPYTGLNIIKKSELSDEGGKATLGPVRGQTL